MPVTGIPGIGPERTFVGGVWSRGMNAIWPMARMEFWDWGIRVRGSFRGIRWLVPVWEARYEGLSAQLVAASLASRGILVRAGEADPVVFWTRRGGEIGDLLQMHGVPVDRSGARLSWGANLYHP